MMRLSSISLTALGVNAPSMLAQSRAIAIGTDWACGCRHSMGTARVQSAQAQAQAQAQA